MLENLPAELRRVAAAHAVECALDGMLDNDAHFVYWKARWHYTHMFSQAEEWPERHTLT